MIDAEYGAVQARLVADSALTVRDTVYDTQGAVFHGTYAVLFGGAPDVLDDERVSAVPDVDSDATYVYTVRCVAPTAEGARFVMKHVCAQLIKFAPTISGRRCDPIRLTHAADVEPDTTVKPILFYADLEFTLISRRG